MKIKSNTVVYLQPNSLKSVNITKLYYDNNWINVEINRSLLSKRSLFEKTILPVSRCDIGGSRLRRSKDDGEASCRATGPVAPGASKALLSGFLPGCARGSCYELDP